MFAVLAIGMGTAMDGAEHRLEAARGSSHAMAVVLGAPDAVMLTARVTSGGHATIVMSRRDRALVFTASGLHGLPPARAYQLWVMGPGGPRSAGLLRAGAGGRAGPMVVSGLSRGDRVGLTVEPAGWLRPADRSGHPHDDPARLTRPGRPVPGPLSRLARGNAAAPGRYNVGG